MTKTEAAEIIAHRPEMLASFIYLDTLAEMDRLRSLPMENRMWLIGMLEKVLDSYKFDLENERRLAPCS